MDKERLIGKKEDPISQKEIDAWHRGDQDAVKNKLLTVTRQLTVDQAVKLIKMYAALGDIHYLATRFDIPTNEAKQILAAFGIDSIEDAKRLVNEGIIAELDSVAKETQREQELADKADFTAAQARFNEQNLAKAEPEKSAEETNAAFTKRSADAQRKNKEDQLRQLISEGIDPDTNTSNFRVPLNLITAFKQSIPHGVSHLQRKFGGTPADIVNEIKRLAPNIEIDMLRP